MLLFPSRYEGMPGTVVEAQASGLPCVISSAITDQVVITDRVKVLDLDAPIGEWTDTICKIISDVRVHGSERIRYRTDVVTNEGKPISDTLYDVNKQVEYYTKLYTDAGISEGGSHI
jgi:glycosyltransferase involved in cell wall biosynthesis